MGRDTVNMVNSIVFDYEMILYWDYQDDLGEGYFCTFADGNEMFRSTKTHVEMSGLNACQEYKIRIEMRDPADTLFRVIYDDVISTTKRKRKIDITKSPYFAIGDGKVLNTAAIQKAIDDCGSEDTVYIPSGTYLSGALELHSNMELYIDEGAVLQGTTNVSHYLPKRHSRFEGIEMLCYSSLLNAGNLDSKSGYNCENVIIRGKGIINGGGNVLRENIIETERALLKDYIEGLGDKLDTYENANTIPGRARGRLINLSNCKNVIITGVGIHNSPSWNMHMIYSDNIVTYGCHFHSEGISNGDGWNPDSSTNCTVFNCTFSTGDNVIAIKSGKNPHGNIINRPSKNIKVFDCRSTAMGGGCAIGSEMSGGVEDVYIWDCDFSTSFPGITVKANKDRGGYVRNVYIKNCVSSVFSIRSAIGFNNDGEPAPDEPYFEGFYLDNVRLKGWDPISGKPFPALYFTGFEKDGHALSKVVLRNVTLERRPDGKNQNIELWCVEGLVIDGLNSL